MEHDNHSTTKKSESRALTLPLPLAWIFAILGAILPVMIVFNPGNKFGLTGSFGICSLVIMVFILGLFLADAIVSKIKYKPVWIAAIILVPSICQIVYLICREKMIQ